MRWRSHSHRHSAFSFFFLSSSEIKTTWPIFNKYLFIMDAEAILASRKAQYKSTEVNKEVELQFDLGNLLATDLNSLDTDALR